MDLDELQPVGRSDLRVDGCVRRLDEGRLAHAARAPEQGVVGRQA